MAGIGAPSAVGSATYLATGRLAVVQDTGFNVALPTGVGVVPFSMPAEAVDALKRVTRGYKYHSRAARELAREYLDAERLLSSMLQCLAF